MTEIRPLPSDDGQRLVMLTFPPQRLDSGSGMFGLAAAIDAVPGGAASTASTPARRPRLRIASAIRPAVTLSVIPGHFGPDAT